MQNVDYEQFINNLNVPVRLIYHNNNNYLSKDDVIKEYPEVEVTIKALALIDPVFIKTDIFGRTIKFPNTESYYELRKDNQLSYTELESRFKDGILIRNKYSDENSVIKLYKWNRILWQKGITIQTKEELRCIHKYVFDRQSRGLVYIPIKE